jgi:hypothetical protein
VQDAAGVRVLQRVGYLDRPRERTLRTDTTCPDHFVGRPSFDVLHHQNGTRATVQLDLDDIEHRRNVWVAA